MNLCKSHFAGICITLTFMQTPPTLRSPRPFLVQILQKKKNSNNKQSSYHPLIALGSHPNMRLFSEGQIYRKCLGSCCALDFSSSPGSFLPRPVTDSWATKLVCTKSVVLVTSTSYDVPFSLKVPTGSCSWGESTHLMQWALFPF